MTRSMQQNFFWVAFWLATMTCVLAPQPAHAVVAISTAGVASDTTDYGPSGLDVAGFNAGNLGYWFANYNASAPSTMAPVDQDDVNSLPSWVSVQFNPVPSATYSFNTNVTSTGGQSGYNMLTLPDGNPPGLSGQLVDNINAPGTGSNTIVQRWMFGAGVPDTFYLSVVLDNTGTATPPDGPTIVQRLRASHRSAASPGAGPEATYDNLAAGANGTADVYTFLLTGAEVGGQFTLQLRTNGNVAATADTGLAGIMFSGVPEPSTAALLVLGTIGGTMLRRRD